MLELSMPYLDTEYGYNIQECCYSRDMNPPYHPADIDVLALGGVPNPWLNFLAELTGAIPLVAFTILFVIVYGTDRLANREVPGPEVVGLELAERRPRRE